MGAEISLKSVSTLRDTDWRQIGRGPSPSDLILATSLPPADADTIAEELRALNIFITVNPAEFELSAALSGVPKEPQPQSTSMISMRREELSKVVGEQDLELIIGKLR